MFHTEDGAAIAEDRHGWSLPGRILAGLFIVITFILAAGSAHAEGSRTLFPLGYFSGESGNTNPAATRSSLYYSASATYLGVIRQQNFFYVYARSGEYILLGTSGSRSALRLFAPPAPGQTLQQRFGAPGLENPASLTGLTLSGTNCTNNSANIGSRSAELAGPNSANGSATVTNGYTPCYYAVTTTGIYGVSFGTAADTNMWDVTVRNGAGSLQDIPGRLFSYSFAGNTGSETNGTYATHYYITDDGYRYSQIMRGLSPFRYVLYSNPQGFLDFNGDPLYRNVRGQSHTLDSLASGSYFRPAGTGIQAQRPTYPMFFVNVVDPAVDTADGLRATLTALDIPLQPEHPVALSATFEHAYTGGSATYVGQGGVFTIRTEHALTYQILLKFGNDPQYDDPAHPDNRVLTGIATNAPQGQHVLWDGLNNAGVPMPSSADYTFEATGRAGEVHFPFLDAEANLTGGPTVTRLNGEGAPNSIVYYDDRGYTTNGVNVGTPNGHLCGPGYTSQPTPDHSLIGVDSNVRDGSNRYYRYWGAAPNTGNTGNDCAASGYYGDAKGMDLWALIRSEPPPGELSLQILDAADVTATVSAPESVAPGGTAVVVANFGNVGSLSANDTSYVIQLPPSLAGVSCTGANCNYNPANGLVTIAGLPTSLSPGQWTNGVVLEYTAPANGSVPVEVVITTSTAQPAFPSPQAPDTATITTLVAGSATVADVLAQLSAPSVAAPGGSVNVTVTFRNLGPLSAAGVVYAFTLPEDLTGVICASPAICSYDSNTGAVAVSGLPGTLTAGQSVTTMLSYTASQSGTIPVTASIDTSTPENDAGNNTASALTVVSTETVADVTASVAPPAEAVEGTTVNVPVIFRNLGPQAAAGVTYTVTLSGGLDDVACSSPVTCNYNSGTGALVLTAGVPATLQNGQVVAFTVSYTAPPPATVTFSATVNTSTAESNTDNNAASAQTLIIPTTYTVTFESNSGSAVSPITGVEFDDTITAPADPTRVGYTFSGWYKESGLINLWDFDTDTVTASITLYAGWQLNTYALTYTAGANGSITGTSPQMVSHGGSGSAVTAVPNAGYHFVQWSDGLTTASRTDTNVTGPISLTASFAINEYTLAYTAGANGTITGTSPQTVNHGSDGSTVTAVPNAGYHFVQWSDGLTTPGRTDTNVTGDLSLAASFAINEYTLTYTAGVNGTITGASPQTVNHGSDGSTVTAVPDPSYRFVGWSDGLTTAARTDTNVTGSLSVTAIFALDEFTLSYTAGTNGSISGAVLQTVNQGGDGAAVTAVPDTGYHFVQWSDGLTTATRTDTNVIGDLSLIASFAINEYTLSYTAGPNGTISGASPQTVDHGSSGTEVTAVPDDGHRFFRWDDGATGESRTDTNVTGDISVVASFARVEEYTLVLGGEQAFDRPGDSTLVHMRRIRGGVETRVDNPSAADYADFLVCDGDTCRFSATASGQYEFTFIDGEGEAHILVLIVHPNIGFVIGHQLASAGMTVRVRVVLDDLPIAEEVRVAYAAENGVSIGSPQPADLLTRFPQELLLNVGALGNVTCFEAGHCYKDLTFAPTASVGEILFALQESAGVVIGNYPQHVVELAPADVVPLTASLSMLPGRTVTVGTPVTVEVNGLAPGNYAFDWSGSDNATGIGAGTAGTAAPATTLAGNYLVQVIVRDVDHPNRAPITLQAWLRVIASSEQDEICGADGCDDDGTGIPTDHQAAACGLGMDDPVSAVPYRLQVGVKSQNWDTAGLCLETLPGYGLRLGTVALLSSPNYGAGVDGAAVQNFGNNGRQTLNAIDYTHDHAGIAYDFEVIGLDAAGHSVSIVAPLPHNLTIPASAVWRAYHPVDGWTSFVVDAKNTLHSAPRVGGQCPSPISGAWNDNPGLVQGLDCVRLIIEDGGPNDMDRQANGVIADLGTLAAPVVQRIVITSSGGSGAMSPLMLLAAGLLLLWRLRRAGRSLPAAALAALMVSAPSVGAEEGIRTPGWFIGGTAGIALGEEDSGDVTGGLFDHGINAPASVKDKNRFAGRMFGGYRFGDHLSLEAGYVNLGRVTTEVEGNPVDLNEIPGVLPASGTGWDLGLSGYLPIAERLDLYGRVGAWHWETRYHLRQTGQERRPKASGLDALGGLGIRYWINARWQTGLSWDRYRVDGQNVDLLGLSVVYQLPSKRHTPALAPEPAVAPMAELVPQPEPEPEPEPETVVEQPPEPAVAVAAPPVEPRAPVTPPIMVVRFDFDSAVITAAASDVVDEATAFLETNPEYDVRITGHTDVLGGNDYNQRLSLRRARAVAAALVARGVNDQRIAVSARGLHEPLFGNLDADSRSMDRRVDIVPVPRATAEATEN